MMKRLNSCQQLSLSYETKEFQTRNEYEYDQKLQFASNMYTFHHTQQNQKAAKVIAIYLHRNTLFSLTHNDYYFDGGCCLVAAAAPKPASLPLAKRC